MTSFSSRLEMTICPQEYVAFKIKANIIIISCNYNHHLRLFVFIADLFCIFYRDESTNYKNKHGILYTPK